MIKRFKKVFWLIVLVLYFFTWPLWGIVWLFTGWPTDTVYLDILDKIVEDD